MPFADDLRKVRLIGIVRGRDPEAALAATVVLVEAGLSIVEVSLTVPNVLDVISRARAQLGPGTWLGAGTVLTAEDATRAADAGASFIVTPALGPGVDAAVQRRLPVVAGAFTPSEVAAAHRGNAIAVKLFPASTGGLNHLRALREPFPRVDFIPVGGVDERAARDYLDAGAAAVGVGSPLVGDAASGGSLGELRTRARRFLEVTTT